MEFWSKLNAALKQKGFSAVQIRNQQEAFGHLDTADAAVLAPGSTAPGNGC